MIIFVIRAHERVPEVKVQAIVATKLRMVHIVVRWHVEPLKKPVFCQIGRDRKSTRLNSSHG